jgi:hypothetical protein
MRNLVHQLNVKFSAAEFKRLRKVREHTGLALANIVRRSAIEMLPEFERTRFPGVPSREAIRGTVIADHCRSPSAGIIQSPNINKKGE